MTRTIAWAKWVGGLGVAVGIAMASVASGCTNECQTGADCVGDQVCISNDGLDSRDNPFEKEFVGVCTCPPGGCGQGAGGATGGFGPFGGFANTGGYNFGGFGNLGNPGGNGNAGGEGDAGGTGGSGGTPAGGAGGNGGAPNGGAAGAPTGGNGGGT